MEEDEIPLATRKRGGNAPKIDLDLIYRIRNGKTVPPPDASQESDNEKWSVRLADKVAAFAGSVTFFFLNAGWFIVWIVVNTLLPKMFHFDPYPYQFLTMAVSLEAIFLSIFVLISENRQAEKDRIMIERDYETNRQSEAESRLLLVKIEELSKKFDEMLKQ